MTSLLKKILLALPIALGVFLLVIFIFGDIDPIRIEVTPKVPTLRTESVSALNSYEQLTPENITKNLADDIAKELIAQNPNGPQITGAGHQIAALNPEELVQKVLENTFTGLQINDLRPSVAMRDLIIVHDSNTASNESYLRTINQIFSESFPESLTINRSEPEKTNFAGFVLAFDNASKALYRVAVPRQFAALHQQLISLLGAQRNAFNLIKNYAADPAQAAVALEAGDTFGKELIDVFTVLNTYAAEHGIVIAQG